MEQQHLNSTVRFSIPARVPINNHPSSDTCNLHVVGRPSQLPSRPMRWPGAELLHWMAEVSSDCPLVIVNRVVGERVLFLEKHPPLSLSFFPPFHHIQLRTSLTNSVGLGLSSDCGKPTSPHGHPIGAAEMKIPTARTWTVGSVA
jgi:hypothetical protein